MVKDLPVSTQKKLELVMWAVRINMKYEIKIKNMTMSISSTTKTLKEMILGPRATNG